MCFFKKLLARCVICFECGLRLLRVLWVGVRCWNFIPSSPRCNIVEKFKLKTTSSANKTNPQIALTNMDYTFYVQLHNNVLDRLMHVLAYFFHNFLFVLLLFPFFLLFSSLLSIWLFCEVLFSDFVTCANEMMLFSIDLRHGARRFLILFVAHYSHYYYYDYLLTFHTFFHVSFHLPFPLATKQCNVVIYTRLSEEAS